MVTLPGSFQKSLGCTDNWKPGCLAPLLEPVGDGTYTYATTALPEGDYEFKVAIGGSDNENYGQDGVVGGANYQFATKANKLVTFTYDSATHKVDIASADAPVAGAGEQRAYWVTCGHSRVADFAAAAGSDPRAGPRRFREALL